jgi:hypothetical protein
MTVEIRTVPPGPSQPPPPVSPSSPATVEGAAQSEPVPQPDETIAPVPQPHRREPAATPVSGPVLVTVPREPAIAEEAPRIRRAPDLAAAASAPAPQPPRSRAAPQPAMPVAEASPPGADTSSPAPEAGPDPLQQPAAPASSQATTTSASPPAAPTAAALAAAPVLRQIADAIGQTAAGSIEIRLSPEELGHVRMSLHSVDGGLSVQIGVERPETLDLIRRHLPDLERAFRDLGHQSLSFAFSEGRPDRQPAQPQPSRPTATPGFDPTPAQGSPASPGTLRVASGLDLRL